MFLEIEQKQSSGRKTAFGWFFSVRVWVLRSTFAEIRPID